MRLPNPIPPEGFYITLNWAATEIKDIPLLSLGHNNLWGQSLRLFEDHIETTVILTTTSQISEIESVEVTETIFRNLRLIISWRNDFLTFVCNPENEEDTLDVLRYFQRKGVIIGEKAQHIIDVNVDR